MGLKKKPYKYLIKEEAKAFDKQATLRTKKGLIPDIRKLKKNTFFYNNPYREVEFYKMQWQPVIDNIISISKKNKQKKVLEVGCGTGFLSLELARNKLNVTGIDISSSSIKIAEIYKKKNKIKKKFGKLNYKVLDATKKKLNEKFDTIVFFRSLHHFPYPKKLFKNLIAMSHKKTKLIICEPVRSNFSKLSAHFATITRFSLETWQPHTKKIPKIINNEYLKKINKKINDEYKYLNKGKKTQSPFDNSIDDPKKIINLVKNYYNIINIDYSDAFIDKLIGGLRGKNRFIVGKFLKKYDQYLVDNKILKGTNLFLEAKAK
jgi:2-polyprenyl-3-methyl-5-hydroxy-6-metoxy-1,4-benzoquinol methylase